MAVSVTPVDGKPHSIQLYSDITAEWTSGDDASIVNWTTTATSDVVTHQIQLQNPTPFTEIDNHTEYGSVFYSTPNLNTTFQSGSHDDVRIQFLNNGRLPNTRDTAFRAIEDGWPVFGLSHDLGEVSGPTSPLVFSVGLISFFLRDYQGALSRARAFDSQVYSDAKKISSDYADIVALSMRQAVTAAEITISKNVDGSWNTSDVLVFFKVAHWSVHDLGLNYPNAIGNNHPSDRDISLEETANMVIMALSYAQKTGDCSQLWKYGTILDRWAQTLIHEAIIPGDQYSSDDSFAGHLPNQTNLAIKGVLAIGAMSEVAHILGEEDKSRKYKSIATEFSRGWQALSGASSGKHLTFNYGNPSSWGLTYNLYVDKLLKLNLIPDSVYEMQTMWYKSVALPFGVPLDSRHTYTKTDWQIWTAATVTDNTVRDLFISSVKKYASAGLSSQPFGDWYDAEDGTAEDFRARSVVGGHLALVSPQSISFKVAPLKCPSIRMESRV
ncbi:hypothetical protein H0H92_012571 [Tricholoma furcatifolium]|nr:hypothetical protein H0H92_012571 [Tricholoma furcatifolium]